jgi:septum formation inhibitor-activating ATPase MinD
VEWKLHEVTFLTRKGCPGSPAMLANLASALAELGIPGAPLSFDIGKLPNLDQRTGCGTPTVLIDGVDLFIRAPKAGLK